MVDFDRHRQAAYNLAYERFRAQVSDTAGWGENLAQINQARNMFNDRGVQLWNVVNNIRHGNLRAAANALKSPAPSRMTARKSVAAQFLELEYGIRPLVKDIGDSIKFLTETEFGWRKITASARDVWRDTGRSGSYPTSYSGYDALVDARVKILGKVRVTNPNLFLAGKLGFIDPALPWKLIPYSFVVDWLINVEQVVSSMTDWYGLALDEAQHTYFFQSRASNFSGNTFPAGIGYSEGSVRTDGVFSSVEVYRNMGLPGPTLVLRPWKGFSMERGAQAIALVIGALDKSRPPPIPRV